MVKSRAEAEDLLQETFADAFRARETLAAVVNVEAWLFAIARNRALAALRRQRRWRRVLERLAHEDPQPSPPELAAALAVRDLLIRTLTPEERALILLRHCHGFSSDELAAMTERSPAAVRQALSRARRRLIRAATEEVIS